MILATDLDGTFLGGKSIDKQKLYRLIRKNKTVKLVFVTGRGLETVIPLLNDPIIPNPDFIICDVGATIVNGYTLEPIEAIQNSIEQIWPGELKILETFKNIPNLQYQEVPQQRRCSFYLDDENLLEQLSTLAEQLGCNVLHSAGKYLDVLPKGINKGSTLTKLIKHLNENTDNVLVAGDTLNDLSMYKCDFKGVVVGNAEVALKKEVANKHHIYIAKNEGAGGIIEAIEHFDNLKAEIEILDEISIHKESNNVPQLLMLYHRFPYETIEVNGEKQNIPPKSPNGILPTLQGFFANGRSGVWIAWEEVNKNNAPLRNIYIDKEKYPNLMAARIGLTKKEIEIFYKLFSKEAFWPTIFSFIDRAKFNHHHWDHYVNINKLFAQKAAEQADYNAIVWIHDYNLWLVPGFLRELRPDVTIAFFHHTAFPSANSFNILPWRGEIIGSLLQCNYIGFHIPRYVENFVDVAKSLFPVKELEKVNCAPRYLTYSSALGVQQMTTLIDTGQNKVKLGANPVGINVQYIKTLMQQAETQKQIADIKQLFANKKMIISVERLDYVKGPLEKVMAYEQFLNDYPEYHGKVELVNICTPPAQGMKIYEKTQHDLEQAVGRINGRYANMHWVPIRLFFRSFPFEEIISYYAAADIAWITPLRDGLNLVAKEYIAVQGEMPNARGVLVLSEFAGAAVELPYAIHTNPYDGLSLKEGLVQALSMNEEDAKMRLQRLYEQVSYYDIDYWAKDFLQQLN
ncbi:glucosylglycerol-phosphate synthase [Hydrotalea sp.]|uniref:glucosylglycerol-phosphate synthase n=1 Tax=Hydrotalea sp. TaxID=2881279 RepID=UPI003D1017CA